MNNTAFINAIIFASIAAIGNAIFAYGQKKSTISENPFIFITFSLIICLLLFIITAIIFKKVNITDFIKINYKWFIISGIGFFLTFIGFYFLYNKFGTSFYVLYAVLSIITTSIIVGIILFKEKYNVYFLLSIITAMITIVLFTLGKINK